MSSPAPSRYLMIATYLVGAVGLALAFAALAAGEDQTAGRWAAGIVVGGSGLLSFVRHSLLHRSDAVRMGWDDGHRNNFQIEVGLANLAVGVGGITSVLLDAGARAQGIVVGIYGLYILSAAAVHVSDIGQNRSAGRERWGPAAATAAFGSMLLVCALALVGA